MGNINRFIRDYRGELFRHAQTFDSVDATGNISESSRLRINQILHRSAEPIMHPELFTWDFSYLYNMERNVFDVFFLCAPKETVPDDKHHFHAVVGHAITTDFSRFEWVSDSFFTPQDRGEGWDNTSIWSNQLLKDDGAYSFYYTSRDQTDNELTQHVGLATGHSLRCLKRVENFKLSADPRWYLTETIESDPTIHAWRDPFVFTIEGVRYMLLSAKDKAQPLGRNGCIALLRERNRALNEWEVLPPIVSPGCYSEMEEPELLISDTGEYVVTYSSWAKHDHAPSTDGQGGLHAISIGVDFFSPQPSEPIVLLPEKSGVYAAHVVPELHGEIIGFDIVKGGFLRSGIFTSLNHVERCVGVGGGKKDYPIVFPPTCSRCGR